MPQRIHSRPDCPCNSHCPVVATFPPERPLVRVFAVQLACVKRLGEEVKNGGRDGRKWVWARKNGTSGSSASSDFQQTHIFDWPTVSLCMFQHLKSLHLSWNHLSGIITAFVWLIVSQELMNVVKR